MRRRSPLVSVYVANFNNARYLRECLNSILTQTMNDLEVVVVDDHSTDESMDILEHVEDPRVRVHRNDSNVGIAAVRNIAVDLCHGHYVTSLDADDIYYVPDKLAKELTAIRQYRATTRPPVAFSDIMHIDAVGRDLHQVSTEQRLLAGDLHEPVLERSILIPRDYLCTKNQLSAAGVFDEELALYEDWDMKIRLARRFPFVFSGVVGIGYRRHGMGLSAAPDDVQAHWMQVVRDRYVV